jgi:hypothetical protein
VWAARKWVMSDEWYLGVECMDNNKHTILYIDIYNVKGSFGKWPFIVCGEWHAK